MTTERQSTRTLSHSRIVPMIVGLPEDTHALFMDLLAPGIQAFERNRTDRGHLWMNLSGYSSEMLVAGRVLASLVDLIRDGELEIGGFD